MDYSRIPEELKNQNQWVCAWDGSKVPMRAFERKAASSTAPDTWSTFEQAEWAVENGHYDHIGYVFADQNIVGIDIDASLPLIHREVPEWTWSTYPHAWQAAVLR